MLETYSIELPSVDFLIVVSCMDLQTDKLRKKRMPQIPSFGPRRKGSYTTPHQARNQSCKGGQGNTLGSAKQKKLFVDLTFNVDI